MVEDAKDYFTLVAYIPGSDKRRWLSLAEREAIRAIVSYPINAATVELFWLVFNFEYRKHIERVLKRDANL